MKQNISVEQLNELSDKGKEKLRQWVFSKMQKEAEEANPNSYVSISPPIPRDLLLSTGEMIDFLDEKYIVEINYQYRVRLTNKWEDDKLNSISFVDKKELSDALWQATKEVLND